MKYYNVSVFNRSNSSYLFSRFQFLESDFETKKKRTYNDWEATSKSQSINSQCQTQIYDVKNNWVSSIVEAIE